MFGDHCLFSAYLNREDPEIIFFYMFSTLNIQAGLQDDNFCIAEEPIVSSMFCLGLRTTRIQSRFDATVKSGMKYMVIDLGGKSNIKQIYYIRIYIKGKGSFCMFCASNLHCVLCCQKSGIGKGYGSFIDT